MRDEKEDKHLDLVIAWFEIGVNSIGHDLEKRRG